MAPHPGGKTAIVIGAGLAGLTAGYRLKQNGWQVKVIEASGEVGGRVATMCKQGYRFDTGAVGIGTVYKDYMALVSELGLDDRLVESSRISATVRDGVLHEIDSARPLSGLKSKLFSLRSKLRLANLFWDLRKIKPHLDIRDVAAASQFDDESVVAYSHRRLDAELLEYFIQPLCRTVNLTRAEHVSKLELMNSLAGLFDTTLMTLRGGLAVLPQALAAQLDVQTHATAQSVRRQGECVVVSYTDTDGSLRSEDADACVVATPLPIALDLYPQARAQYGALADALFYNRGLCVHLGYSAPTRTRALLVMLPPSEYGEIALFFNEHNKGPDRAPAGHSTITAFYDENEIDRAWNLDDASVITDTAAVLERLMPELAGKLEMSHVSRWPYGLPNPSTGLYKIMHKTNRSVDPADRVQLAGDFRSTAGQNSAVASGNHVAENLVRHFPVTGSAARAENRGS